MCIVYVSFYTRVDIKVMWSGTVIVFFLFEVFLPVAVLFAACATI